ncbi:MULTISPECIES: GIY-YIG nuclease family protein [unclassified Lentimicrobium]|uniref:GIY-YIG nuclease family protein n=1 Tax=unclassified Lentimicrobium TaxID=2677434 RepID=UPI0015571448|nr:MULTISPECIES: GIY-YIG nuclease family protein [unclassified Lentimicrobium]NPD46249.1 GIY-YIG nuclease family protein [Lentimicrobium sp. S6]NPD83983.1 GIY-YIG nuclease family protein [Lentimicrobium sp. L6]
MTFGKTIKLFLIDGDTNGRLACELSNWTGKAYKIPRKSIKTCADRPELMTTGVYMLLNRGTELSEKGQIYIGEAEDIYKRLIQHLKEKDFWNDAIVFISKDDNLNKAHIKYLENRLHEIATKANRYDIINSQTPTQSSISESDRAEMEEYLANVLTLINTLGYNTFEQIRQAETNQTSPSNDDWFYISATRGANGTGKSTSEGFVAFENSQVAEPITKSYPQTMKKLRDALIEEKVIIEVDNKLILSKDYLFSSSSSAAMIIMGRSANGLTEWKLKSGQTLQEFESGLSD